MVKSSKAATEAYYRQLVAEHEGSGLSVREFAARRGIPAGTLSAWRHELRKRDAARARRDVEPATSPFVQVKVIGVEAAASRPARAPIVYEVELGQGRVLRLPAEFDETRVAALVRAVAPC